MKDTTHSFKMKERRNDNEQINKSTSCSYLKKAFRKAFRLERFLDNITLLLKIK